MAGGEDPNWNQIQKILKAASDELPPLPKETNTGKGLPKNIRELITKRETLKGSPKTRKNKIELNLVCKQIKILSHNLKKTKSIIVSAMETTKSTKQIRKQLSTGCKLMTCLEYKEGIKEYDRMKINQIATDFYKSPYSDESESLSILETEEEEPESAFLIGEIERAVLSLKEGRAARQSSMSI